MRQCEECGPCYNCTYNTECDWEYPESCKQFNNDIDISLDKAYKINDILNKLNEE